MAQKCPHPFYSDLPFTQARMDVDGCPRLARVVDVEHGDARQSIVRSISATVARTPSTVPTS
jgi:hypothetical protein